MSNLKKLEGEVDVAIVQLTTIFRKDFAETGKTIDLSDWLK
jgi:hypothetical protein